MKDTQTTTEQRTVKDILQQQLSDITNAADFLASCADDLRENAHARLIGQVQPDESDIPAFEEVAEWAKKIIRDSANVPDSGGIYGPASTDTDNHNRG